MLKTLNTTSYHNSKCAEIVCQGRKDFSIICSFCNMKTSNYDHFREHFQSIHSNVFEAQVVETDAELPVELILKRDSNRTLLKHDGGQSLALEVEPFDKTHNIWLVADEKVKEEEVELFSDANQHEDEIPLSRLVCNNFQNVLNQHSKTKNADLDDSLTKEETYADTGLKFKSYTETKCKQKPLKRVRFRKTNELNDELKCPICGIYKNNKYNLQSHINSHTGARPYNCQQCGNNFTNSGNLWKHIELVHKGIRTHECSECNKTFQFKSQAKRHEMRVHLKTLPFPCDICKNSYFSRKELIEHKHRDHSVTETTTDANAINELTVSLKEVQQSKQSKYVCEHCGKSFAKYSGIWAHRRVHTDDKRFICNVCNKPMHTSYHLKEHMNTHTGARPHKCDVCGKAFQQKKFLRDHSRIHSDVKKFVCKICGKKFSQAAGLYCHTKTHKQL